jgi:DNA-binding NarL/FixJ family response regulator
MVLAKSRVLIVDDHPIVVEGYRELINRQQDLAVCGVASTALEALQKATLTKPHLAVIDLVLKDSNGLDLVKDFHIRMPELKMLVVSARDEFVFAERVLHAGAAGYLSKEEATAKLIDAIRDVLRGKICLSPEMTDRLLHRASTSSEEQRHSAIENLADRELQAFELIGRGLSTQEIATHMHISPKTVDRYRENIKDKLKLQSANELLRRATMWVEANH